MNDFLGSVLDVVADLEPREVVGALMVGLGLALSVSGLYALRRRKAHDAPTLLVGLLLLACTASMAVAAGYVRYAEKLGRTSGGPFNGASFGGVPPGSSGHVPTWGFAWTEGDVDDDARAERGAPRSFHRADEGGKAPGEARPSGDVPWGERRPYLGP